MDPVADKILVLAALIMLLQINFISPAVVILLLARDIFIGGVRSVAATENIIIAAKPFGKWKTALQMIAIPCLYLSAEPNFSDLNFLFFGNCILWISVILSLLSGAQYTLGYYKAK